MDMHYQQTLRGHAVQRHAAREFETKYHAIQGHILQQHPTSVNAVQQRATEKQKVQLHLQKWSTLPTTRNSGTA